ncbi:hypothetical protein C0995_001218 [Termitomyces sp. Mi166|nr:hypothetical protein C0995_001218 [Termitomyces sp. Mi166\
MPRHSRHVGQDVNPPVPWHRVIGSSGAISSRGPGTQGAQQQMDALVAEGVDVTVSRNGDMRVDFRQWGWFPEVGNIEVDQGAVVQDVPESNDDEPQN